MYTIFDSLHWKAVSDAKLFCYVQIIMDVILLDRKFNFKCN